MTDVLRGISPDVLPLHYGPSPALFLLLGTLPRVFLSSPPWFNHQPSSSPPSDPEFQPWAATCSRETPTPARGLQIPLTHCDLTHFSLSPNSPPPSSHVSHPRDSPHCPLSHVSRSPRVLSPPLPSPHPLQPSGTQPCPSSLSPRSGSGVPLYSWTLTPASTAASHPPVCPLLSTTSWLQRVSLYTES